MRSEHGPRHLLIITVGDFGLTYRIKCIELTRYCQTFQECGCPESRRADQWDEMTWFDFEGVDTAHGVEHTDIKGEWLIPVPGKCWFETVPHLVADEASCMPAIDGQPPGPGVWLVETVWESYDYEDGFRLRWTGAARLKMDGNLFGSRLPHPHAVYVGRQHRGRPRSPWANPYKTGRPITPGLPELVRDNDHAVALFEQDTTADQQTLAAMRTELAGKVLACWCVPGDPCHGDTTMLLANSEAPL